MPAYEYQCVDCGCREKRVGGLDDHTAICMDCGSLMLRLDDDIFSPYFKDNRNHARASLLELKASGLSADKSLNDSSNGLSVCSSELCLEGQ